MKSIICMALLTGFTGCVSKSQDSVVDADKTESMYSIVKSEEEWKQELTPEQYRVLRQCGTETPVTGKYYKFDEEGKYLCAACGLELFDSKAKYSSGSGWPSFFDVLADSNIAVTDDRSYGMVRTEVKCSRCGSHLGHVFTDGPKPTGLRYCINSVSMQFVPAGTKEDE